MRSRLSHEPGFFLRPAALIFSPVAWLKLQFLCHAGNTEVGGFGISSRHNLLYVEDVVTVRQQVLFAQVRFDDAAVADFFDRSIDSGLEPQQIGRIWIHTHPGSSAQPSDTDEETFHRVFGGCDWAVMFILSRTAQTYARLAFQAGPGGDLLLPILVDWADWPRCVDGYGPSLDGEVMNWQQEYQANVSTYSDRFEPRHSQEVLAALPDSIAELGGPSVREAMDNWESYWEERHEHRDELVSF